MSVYPKPIERQCVAVCLNVLRDEIYSAIINNVGMRNVDGSGHTAAFT